MSEQDHTEQYVPEAQNSSDVFTVSRVVVNYLVIAIVFFITGAAVGVIGYGGMTDSNEKLIDQTVAEAFGQQESALAEMIAVALADAPAAAPAAPTPPPRSDVGADDDPSVGPEDAPILVIEFGDYRCSYCRRWHDETLTPLLENYGDQIQYVYRDFVVLGPASRDASLAAGCAGDQDAFWDYHNLLYTNQQLLNESSTLFDLATQLELDIDQFTACMEAETFSDELANDYQDAVTAGARGTPAFLINGRLVSGALPYANFSAIVDEELAALDEDTASEGSEG